MELEIGGIQVIFPHRPYDIQIQYMTSVIDALDKKQNALLESPTGTGKTLSLLCSTLAWLENQKFKNLDSLKIAPPKDPIVCIEDLPGSGSFDNDDSGGKKKGKGKGWKNESPIRIIYSSRTHSQLNQACNELKNCYYKFSPSVTIGSRDQLCINPDVANLETISAKNQTCRFKVKNNLCSYHHNYERKVSDLSFSGSKIYDIQDLIKFGNENKACPYYMSKALTDFNTSLTFMPYNYVLDPNIRKTLKLNLENSIIIFDEGHNIERVCEDSMSAELKSEWLALFIKSFDALLLALNQLQEGKYEGEDKDLKELNIIDVAKVKMTICDLELELDKLVKQSPNSNYQTKGLRPTEEIFKIMVKINLDYERCKLVCSICEKIILFVMNSTVAYMKNQTIAALVSICSFLETIIPFSNINQNEFFEHKKEFIKNYKLYTEIQQENNYKKTWLKTEQTTGWTVYLWCMSPSVAIKSLQRHGIYNLIITSGTMAPLESFECEMGIPFLIKLQNSHVISSNQLSIQLTLKDPNGYELCGSFEKRNDSKYYKGLGLTILEMARTIPKGVFIFFSSYTLINRCIEEWKDNSGVNIWSGISSLKKIFVEPRNKKEFQENIESFRYAIDNTPEGAIFMGVSRGKLSEGIDMGDDYCRAVIIIGLPYPARYDPKVLLKQQYLNENHCKLNGNQWYMLQMKRALNQSIGRVVRHKNDYGLIILCDSRFRQLNDGFSKWILPFFDRKNGDLNFRHRIQQIKAFFRDAQQNRSQTAEEKSTNEQKFQTETKSTPKVVDKPAGLFRMNSKRKTPPSDGTDKSGHFENIFNTMKTNYTAIKDQYEKPKCWTNQGKQSVFETFDLDSPIFKPKSKAIGPFSSNDSAKKSRYFTSPVKTEDHDVERKSNKKTSLFLKKDPFDVDCKVIDSSKENESTGSPSSCISKDEKFDFESQDVIDIKNTILKTQHNIQTFNAILQEILHQPSRCRQLMETFRIFHKKRNSTYLALRLNFILAIVDGQKRTKILEDISLFVPERERKHFLRICNVNA